MGLVKQALQKGIGKICMNIVQLETILKEGEAFVNLRPLLYVGAELNSGLALTPGDVLSLNPTTSVPCLATEDKQLQDPHFIDRPRSARKLLETWKKGRKHRNTFLKLWFDEYALSLRETTQNHLKVPRVQTKAQPTKGEIKKGHQEEPGSEK